MILNKFRAWDKKNKKMHRSFESWFIHPETYSIDCGIRIGDWIDEDSKITDFIIEQCVNQQDIESTDIYDGDILKDEYGRIYKVFDGGKIKSYSGEYDITLVEWEQEHATFTVIGNIHENPELIK